MPYIELHASSAYSFLRGGSLPEALAEAAARCGLPALALCDRGGVYGSVRLHQAARDAGIRALVGCELGMENGAIVPVLVASQAGYRRLCSLLTTANLRAAKGGGRIAWGELGGDNDGLVALTGDAAGPVRRAWHSLGTDAAAAAGDKLLAAFGPGRLYAEIQRHLVPGEEAANEFVVDWARAKGIPLLATNGVLYATPAARQVADVFTCLREGVTLDGAGRKLARNSERHIKPAAGMSALFADLPEAIANTEALAERLPFTLADIGYHFPDYRVPSGESQDSFLRKMTYFGAQQRYGSIVGAVRQQIERELALIGKLGFPGYFLIVWDLCAFARERGILVQGRGSAANSVVCYSLGITAVDPIDRKLLFERFLSEGRTDWPDIDLDLPSGPPRESVIQEVYRRYGRLGAAMTANVITYRGRNTMREVGKAFGLPGDLIDRFSSLFHGGDYPHTLKLREQLKMAGADADHPRLPMLIDTCRQVYSLPRHLSQHSGGVVLSAGNLSQFVPLENARMENRSVLQWDKTDCEDMGIVKVDLLGLRMMSVIQDTLEISSQRGQAFDLARIPKDDPATFRMMQEADTIGVFQIESRAQMSTLPRMKPETFYDLAIEVAIIRPGPIQGNAVNPYLARRAGREPVTYPDERARPILERTLGVVLFQEQILRLAMELGGFSAAEADELRRAIGFTRTPDRMNRMKDRLKAGLRQNNVSDAATESILNSLASFALYGFPESHAISFALLAYASAWAKVHRAAAFYAALLNNQPMGFYSSATLVQDARRHGIRVLPACVALSDEKCRVETDDTLRLGVTSIKAVRAEAVRAMLAARAARPFADLADFLRRTSFSSAERRSLSGAGALNTFTTHRRAAMWQVEADHPDDDLFKHMAAEDRTTGGPEDQRAGGSEDQMICPSTGEKPTLRPSDPPVLRPSGLQTLWPSGPPALRPMSYLERLHADYRHTDLTTGSHPMKLLRPHLPGVTPAAALPALRPSGPPILRPSGLLAPRPSGPPALRVCIAGSVICRQRPGTAKGFCFITIEDETGLANAIVRPKLFEKYRLLINLEPALMITGRLQNEKGVIHIMAEKIEPLPATGLPTQSSHDYH